jgi:hypothetical protein
MKRHTIRVECYSGGRSDETPRRISFEGREHVVARLLAESIEESPASNQQTRRYKVVTGEGLVLEVVRLSDGTWRLVSQALAE